MIAPMPAGGAESVARALSAGRARMGRPTHLVALLDRAEPDPYLEQARRMGAVVHVVESGGRRYVGEMREARTILREVGADVVHAHGYHADFVAFGAARTLGIPCVATFHGNIGGGLRNTFYEWLDHRLLARMPAVIGVSGRTVEDLVRAGCRRQRIHLVRNGHDGRPGLDRAAARRALDLDADCRVIGWVGRLSPEKGPDLLVEALAKLKAGPVDVVMIGDGALRPGVESSVPPLESRAVTLRVAGIRHDASDLHRAFDVLAITSRSENLPMVLIEAMAAGTPVVAFGVGGIPELLSRDTGWPVEPGDTAALAGALREVLEEPAEGTRRAANARMAVEAAHGIERWVDDVETIYGSIVRRRPGGAADSERSEAD